VSERVIRASEIGQYVYCAHAWWLGNVEGIPSSHLEEMAAGEAVHRQHGRGVRAALLLRRLAYAVLLLAAIAALFWLLGRGG
jgi:CRISPR/Cas system-associated exonuclease Cas4 (RecB family)